MSFYNVTNPTSFSVVSDTRKSLVNPGKLTRSSAVQKFASYTSSTITPEQLIQGVLFVDATASQTMTLPTASDLIQLLMGPGGYDVSANDIFALRLVNYGSQSLLVAANSSGGSGGSITVAAGVQRLINVQLTNVTSGTYAYSIF
jgi:hypothetical protein